jgi:hypothetical protein
VVRLRADAAWYHPAQAWLRKDAIKTLRKGEICPQIPCMHVHIHHRDDRKYLARNGDWVPDANSARAFANAREATEYCRAENLKKVELHIVRPQKPTLTMPVWLQKTKLGS